MTHKPHRTDADRNSLRGKTVGVFGFGNQGSAQAHCLRDEGLEVLVFGRPHSASSSKALAEGFAFASAADIGRCEVLAVLTPDETQREILEGPITAGAAPGTLLVFAHGFALREGAKLRPDLDGALVGPLGPGSLLRARYLEGHGLPGILAIVQDVTGTAALRAHAYANHLRMTHAGLLPTTLEEEVVSDLFAEQVVLVGGANELIHAAWETLTDAGVSPEIAYYSCVNELKQILDLVVAEGPAGMRERISNTAKYGGLTRGPRVIGDASRAAMREILREIRSGAFAAEWRAEREAGSPRLKALLREEARHPMESARKSLESALEARAPKLPPTT